MKSNSNMSGKKYGFFADLQGNENIKFDVYFISFSMNELFKSNEIYFCRNI